MGDMLKRELEMSLRSRIGDERYERFRKSTVAVCGLGGLGSNIAVSLVRAGVGKLILTDFDRVDISNLNRQQYKMSQIGMYKTDALLENLVEISPLTELEIHSVKLSEDNYADVLSGADIICEAFDVAEEKSRLVNFVLENMPDKYIVSGSGMAGIGSPNLIKTKRVMKRLYMCGDGVSSVDDGDTLYSARVALCASHQALTVLRLIDGREEV